MSYSASSVPTAEYHPPVFQPGARPRGTATAPAPPRRGRRAVRLALLFIVALPALLTPGHPLAVYTYLLDTAWTRLAAFAGWQATPGVAESELRAFLRAPELTPVYRAGMLDDMLDTQGGGLFAIVSDRDGRLRYMPLRTWNNLLPRGLPDRVARWLDRKEFTYLSDPVGLWLRGQDIVAMGHYHPYGGGPSPGDRTAQRLSTVPEIIISNGLVPAIYLNGELVPYGAAENAPDSLFRSMRALENGLFLESGVEYELRREPSPRLRSFIAYLSDYRGANIRERASVARELLALSSEFKRQFKPVIGESSLPSDFTDSPELMSVLHNLQVVAFWAYRMG